MSPSAGTPKHTVRVDPDLWAKAKALAEKRDETLSDVLRKALEDYITDD